MPTIPLSVFRTKPTIESSGRLRSSIERVAETQPSAGFARAGEALGEGTAQAANTIGRSFSSLENQIREIHAKDREAKELINASKGFDAYADTVDSGRLEIENSGETDLDKLRIAYSGLHDKGIEAASPFMKDISKVKRAQFDAKTGTYRRGLLGDAFRDAVKKSNAAKRGDFLTSLENRYDLYYQTADPAARQSIEASMIEDINEASKTILSPEDAHRLKQTYANKFKMGAGMEFVENTPYEAAIVAVDESKDYDPEEKSFLISHATTRHNLVHTLKQRSEAAEAKAIREAQDAQAYEVGNRVQLAIRGKKGSELAAIGTEISQLVASKKIDPGYALTAQAIITRELDELSKPKPERPVKDDPRVVAALIDKRDAGEAVKDLAKSAMLKGQLTTGTALSLTNQDVETRKENAYYRVEEYKSRASTLSNDADAMVDAMVSVFNKDFPSVRDGQNAIKNEMKLEFERRAAKLHRDVGGERDKFVVELDNVYQTVIRDFRPMIEDNALAPKPTVKSLDAAVAKYGKDSRDRALFDQEVILLGIHDETTYKQLSPESQKRVDEQRKALESARQRRNPLGNVTKK